MRPEGVCMCVCIDRLFFQNSGFPQIQESTDLSHSKSNAVVCVGVCTHASDADTLVYSACLKQLVEIMSEKRPKTAVCWFKQNKREVVFKIDDRVKHIRHS